MRALGDETATALADEAEGVTAGGEGADHLRDGIGDGDAAAAGEE